MKKLLIAALSLFTCQISAQKFTGTVTDTAGEPMLMAGAAFLNPSDSTVAAFAITNENGYFESAPLSDGSYLMQVSFLGYETYERNVTVGEGGTPSNLGRISLSPAMNSLSEVVINGQRIPVLINKDTVEYDASSFRVRADDNVEDLLKRLPGIEVERDGSITAQGQEVQQVLVDGKEFFGGDPTVATRNIPADAVERVQVYDRQSDDAMYTGVDDGERSKTINLELKEDRRNGYFGYAEGGGGVAENQTPFKVKGGLHSFTNTTRVSILSNLNNVNDYGFSFGDYRDMAGGNSGGGRGGYMITVDGSEGIPLNYGGPDDGLFFSGATGVNLNWDPNRNHRFNASYFFTHLDNFTTTTETSREFLNDTEIQGTRESEDNEVTNSHAFNINHRSDLDTMNRVELRASGRYMAGFSNSIVDEMRSIEGQGLLQSSNRYNASEYNNTSANINLSYIHKFNNKGRVLTVRAISNLSNSENNGEWENYNNFPLNGTIDSLYQSREELTTNQTIRGSVNYTEPLAKNHLLGLSASISGTEESLLRNTFDVYSGGFQDLYSPDFNLSEGSQQGSLSYKYTGEEHNLDISLDAVNYSQSAIEERFVSAIPTRQFFYILPNVNYNWNISSFSRFSFNFGSSAQLPEMTQLLTLQDITNPLIKFQGNASLEPQQRYTIWMNYGSWNSFSGRGFFGYISAGRTDNVISTNQTIDNQYVRTFTPENFDIPAYNANGRLNYSQTIDSWGIRTRTNISASYNTNPSKVNDELNEQTNTSTGVGLGVSTMNNEIFNISVGGDWGYNWSTYSLQTSLNQEYLSHSYYANFDWTPVKGFGVETGVDLQNYSNASFADDQFVPVWNANIRYNLSKTGTAQLELTVFDILNQNRGISRFGNLNAIVERNTNSLGRYVMLTFLYKFNSNMGSGDESSGGHREEIRVIH